MFHALTSYRQLLKISVVECNTLIASQFVVVLQANVSEPVRPGKHPVDACHVDGWVPDLDLLFPLFG